MYGLFGKHTNDSIVFQEHENYKKNYYFEITVQWVWYVLKDVINAMFKCNASKNSCHVVSTFESMVQANVSLAKEDMLMDYFVMLMDWKSRTAILSRSMILYRY